MGGYEFPLVMGQLNMDVTPLYFELDGTFPNHEANPLALDTLEVLRETVVREGADFGVAFDGDADRAGFIDEKGGVVTNDLATALLASDILAREKGPVVYDLRSSKALPEEIERHGGEPVRERVGHSFMKKTMRAKGGVFGGEFSGHYYFRENFNTESASLAVVALCNILRGGDAPLSERLGPLRRYESTGEVNFEVEDKAGPHAGDRGSLRRRRDRLAGRGDRPVSGVVVQTSAPPTRNPSCGSTWKRPIPPHSSPRSRKSLQYWALRSRKVRCPAGFTCS